MSDDADWGPWVDHDGRGCPFPAGVLVEAILEWEVGHFIQEVYRLSSENPSWDWRNWGRQHHDGRKIMAIRRYRVRRPKALRDLIALVETLPAPAPQPERMPEEVAP